MRIVDTHQHLWELDRFQYSWTSGLPVLNRSFNLDDYRQAVAGTDVSKAIFMECDVDAPHGLEEARWAQLLAEENPLIAGIVATASFESEDFSGQLNRLLRLSKLRGLRRVLHTQDDGFSQSSTFRNNLRELPQHGLVFDLCVLSRQLPVAVELVKACPEVSFVLDHCGVPDIKGGAFESWSLQLSELSQCANVVACKVSGLVAYVDRENWNVDTLRPWFDRVVELFGWDRLVWGGDWPVCTVTTDLKTWLETSKELCSGASDSELSKLYYQNAERIYRV
ncbi:amidohydrolase [Pelagicoccus sp. SDUM812005]|uniref:amidohydrolase family protein n=1 Tax=Pelagicoccus sp. SDUM812005 TaxID=3041257 RepID=UPI00280CCA1D|nr:amidohydrolase [Pelagicoccus sp. SDUM812005]MDQ8179388.1 amidohydrolase [Pelagicoccus sp. SDUM812005]